MGYDVCYSPIVSMLDGLAYGYEAIPCDCRDDNAIEPGAAKLFKQAEAAGLLYETDRLFRDNAIRDIVSLSTSVKLFIPIPARIIYDSKLYPGNTLYRIEAAGLRPENVVLVLLGGDEEPDETLLAALCHYRNQGFRVALFGIGADRKSLEKLTLLKPDYARVSESWLPAHSRDKVGESLFQAIAAIARKEKIVLLANGLSNEQQMRMLVQQAVGFAQGPYVGPPTRMPEPVGIELTGRIQQEVRRKYRGMSGAFALQELAEPAQTFFQHTPVSEVARHFEGDRETNGFVIVDEGERPIGLLMREKLHQVLAWQFGLSLYWSRSVDKIMDTQPLVVDYLTPVDQLSQIAMARESDKLYDAVVVTREGRTAGVVSIRSLLEWVTNARMADAQSASPLTGLPGNEPIRRELARRLEDGRPFAIAYADLDHFKWYNDRYGFHRGDDLIRYTGETLLAAVKEYGADESFVGHIGGDDFIVMTYYGNPVKMAEEMLYSFDKGVPSFLNREKGPDVDRSGKELRGATVSLSLALIVCRQTQGWTAERLAEQSALLKKRAKETNGSSLVWEALDSGQFDNTMKEGALLT